MNRIAMISKEVAGGVPEEFQLLPDGMIELEGEEPAVADEEARASVIEAFARRGNDMVIDYEHQTLQDVQAPAAGWIKRFVDKGKEGLWVMVEWTERAKEYLKNREYRYFSPVFWIRKGDRRVLSIENVALTNQPRMNHLRPLMAKMTNGGYRHNQKEDHMEIVAKLKKLLGLADDAGDDAVLGAVTKVVDEKNALETRAAVACKEVCAALGVKDNAAKDDVLGAIEGLKATGAAAGDLSQQVAKLSTSIAEMKRDDLTARALKEGKTSPEELTAWGRNLALKSPGEFEKIVLSRPAGSVIPVEKLPPKDDLAHKQAADEAVLNVAKMMGVSKDDIEKYGAAD